ncbi:MAG: anaerobic ribonucleoside-triphosphate reductase activating protein [Erysipelotrichales bacterium]|nr:anaerobic ribonucleoside-triphosphate reductase activating protein [Erysipelotrichales bacterium]
MNYGEIKPVDIANGIGVRVSLFVSGCRNKCIECFNPMTWSFQYGNVYTKETENQIMELLNKSFIEGLTILGGEPFEPENQETVLQLVKRVKSELPNKNIWIYSGFTYEELIGEMPSRASLSITKDILKNIDILVDGRFEIKQKDLMIKFRGSRNQRIIDVQKTLQSNVIVLSYLNN